MYTTHEDNKIGTRAVSVRIRRDLLDYCEMQSLNRSQLINDALAVAVKLHQRGGACCCMIIDNRFRDTQLRHG